MIVDIEMALDHLGSTIWWLKGFAAGRPADVDAGSGEHLRLEAWLRDVMRLLSRINTGEMRRLGEETAVVLTYAEFERLVDAIRVPQAEEVKTATDTIEKVLQEYRGEAEIVRRLIRSRFFP